jgi:CCR4-NOT transcription complex subunit 6
LVEKYGEMGKLFKRGNVGLICLIKHKESNQKILVACTHIHWNPKYDFVKYGQAFWMMFQISRFIKNHNISLEEVPLIVSGDFNSKPNSSVFHFFMDKQFNP